MITSGLIISYITSDKKPTIKLLHDNNTEEVITLGVIDTDKIAVPDSIAGNKPYSYVKCFLSGSTLFYNIVVGDGSILSYSQSYTVTKNNNDQKITYNQYDVYSNALKDLMSVIFNNNEAAGNHYNYFLYKNLTDYNISNATMIVTERLDNIDDGYLILTFTNLDFERLRTSTGFRLLCKVSINNQNIEAIDNINFYNYENNRLVFFVKVTDKIKEFSHPLNISAQLDIIGGTNFNVATANYSLSYNPIVIDSNLKVYFAINGYYYNLSNKVDYIIPAHSNDSYLGKFYVKSSGNIDTNISNTQYDYNKYDLITHKGTFPDNFKLGLPYYIETHIFTPFSSGIFTSPSGEFYHGEQYLNISDIELKAVGSASESSFYKPNGELSIENKLLTKRYMSAGPITVTANFKLNSNDATLRTDNKNNKIYNQLSPTKSTFILYQEGSDFEKNIPTNRITNTVRSSQNKQLYPNITSNSASGILTNITTWPTGVIATTKIFPSGYLINGSGYTISGIVPDSGKYGAIVVLETGTDLYGYNYTAHNLTNLVNTSEISQFDF